MAAPKGHQFWKLRSKHGKDKIFSTPESLWDAACEYFEWCDNNPLREEKAFSYQGEASVGSVCKLRAYTLKGLCFFLGVNEAYFRQLKDENYSTVVEKIEMVIYEQKFTGAAAELLNPNIIARDLGLSDKKDIRVGDMSSMSDDELDAAIHKAGS